MSYLLGATVGWNKRTSALYQTKIANKLSIAQVGPYICRTRIKIACQLFLTYLTLVATIL